MPFLGAGACRPHLPLGGELARELAEQEGYPFPDKSDLAKVTQYMVVSRKDARYPKDKIKERFKSVNPPDFSDLRQPHRVLADLGLPIYMTTNYDDFMLLALKNRKMDAQREICRWNPTLKQELTSVFDGGFEPTPANPVVFHLHGHTDVTDSMVVTEDDYLDFLVSLSKDLEKARGKLMLPLPIRRAVTRKSLLFIGYGLSDLNFRVILRGLLGSLAKSQTLLSITVQLKPEPVSGHEEEKRQNEEYVKYTEKYFDWLLKLQVYWGSAGEFVQELGQRMSGTK